MPAQFVGFGYISFCLDRLLLLLSLASNLRSSYSVASSHSISLPLHFLHSLQIQIDFNFESDLLRLSIIIIIVIISSYIRIGIAIYISPLIS